MKSLEQVYVIAAPVDKVWQAFVDPETIQKWSGAKAVMDDKVGTKFELWDGEIYGTNTKVVEQQLLEQDWVSEADFVEPTKVVFTFSESGGKTTVRLQHTGIPDDSLEDIDDGWKDFYLGPMKELLEK